MQPARERAQRRDAPGVAVDRAHGEAGRREDEGVAAATAGHVERARPARERGARSRGARARGRRPATDSCSRGPVQRAMPPARLQTRSRPPRRGGAAAWRERTPCSQTTTTGRPSSGRTAGAAATSSTGSSSAPGTWPSSSNSRGRPHVEDDGAQGHEALGLVGRHVLVRARAAVYSDTGRGTTDPIIRASARRRECAGSRRRQRA